MLIKRITNAALMLTLSVIAGGALASCMSGAEHRESLGGTNEDRLTVGTVQRTIRIGMSGAEVTEALGSPNVVTTDEERREVWIYDKISTERVVSSDRAAGGIIFFGYSRQAGAASTSQRTLTVIIKFDHEGRVRDFAYHASRF